MLGFFRVPINYFSQRIFLTEKEKGGRNRRTRSVLVVPVFKKQVEKIKKIRRGGGHVLQREGGHVISIKGKGGKSQVYHHDSRRGR